MRISIRQLKQLIKEQVASYADDDAFKTAIRKFSPTHQNPKPEMTLKPGEEKTWEDLGLPWPTAQQLDTLINYYEDTKEFMVTMSGIESRDDDDY